VAPGTERTARPVPGAARRARRMSFRRLHPRTRAGVRRSRRRGRWPDRCRTLPQLSGYPGGTDRDRGCRRRPAAGRG
jgi:hypothetical protein